MREVMLEVSHVTWTDVGGLDEAKEEVREAVEYPLTDHERFDLIGIRPPRGVLLYGPPGTGKTLIAKAAASESGANFIPIRGPAAPLEVGRRVRAGRARGLPQGPAGRARRSSSSTSSTPSPRRGARTRGRT